MSFHGVRTLSSRFRLVLESWQQSHSLAFADVLTEEQIQVAFDQHGASANSDNVDDEECVFTPSITLWGFLSQVLHKQEQRSCLAAVARIGVLLVSLGRPRCAQNNGPYCRARGRLPEMAIEQLALDIAVGCEAQLPEKWLWKGRHVKLGDGSSVTMADTEANQKTFPQQSCQKEGLGFPIARLVVLLSLATGMTCGMAMGPFEGKETGEMALLRQLLDQLDEGDVFLADKLYCTYFLIAMLLQKNVDLVVRLHQSRKIDDRSATRLGKGDRLVTWRRGDRPQWMDEDTYALMPATLELRLVCVRVNEPGFRTESLDIVTTLIDPDEYSLDDIADLYSRRWLAELDIRAIKQTLGMDELRCKSPEMVRKEVWTCLLAYNFIRQKILQSALEKDVSPRELSFTNAMQVIAAGWMVMPLLDTQTKQVLIQSELESVASQTVGRRPGRVEPRAVKRRPKPYRLLTMARDAARALLRKGIDPFKKQK